MIYDIVNAIVYVVLARLFCSSFLKRKELSAIVDGGITFLWMIVCFSVGTFFVESLLLRIIIVIACNILFAFFLYRRDKIMMSIVIPALFYILALACDFCVVAGHKYFDPNPVINKVFEDYCEYAAAPESVPESEIAWHSIVNGRRAVPEWIISDYQSMVKSVDYVISYDWGLYNIICDEINSYYLQNKSVEDISKTLQSRLDLYVSENYK